MWGHVDDRLAAFCEGTLPESQTQSVAAHLARCPRCEQLRVDVERGLSLVRALPWARLPEDRAEQIRRALADPRSLARAGIGRPRRPRALALAAAGVLLAALAGSYVVHRMRSPALHVAAANAPLSTFEQTAVALQRQAAEGTLRLDLTSDSAPIVRNWVREHTGLDANLALERPTEDVGRFELLGAKQVLVAGARAAAVAYRMDARPAVLLTARAEDVPHRPRSWGLAGKTVQHRADLPSGGKLLSWTNSGQVYALVSELPGLGLESCFVCHADSGRRRLIRRIGSRSP